MGGPGTCINTYSHSNLCIMNNRIDRTFLLFCLLFLLLAVFRLAADVGVKDEVHGQQA
uniref:Uncharacterized protein n=1 Tax=Anguilla anguilla TaxID=7936 RepID=A0A0E9VMK6_ANGAN